MRIPIKNSNVALFSGAGDLPPLVHAGLVRNGARVCLYSIAGTELPWAEPNSVQSITLDSFRERFDELGKSGVQNVVFAGQVERPQETPAVDGRDRRSHPFEIDDGDDAVLTSAVKLVESWGFNVIGPHEILPELVPESGVLTRAQPSELDRKDVARAERIVQAVGAVDVGQAAVVANMICIAVETIAGTDAMLSSAGEVLDRMRPGRDACAGVMYKAPKPDQELRGRHAGNRTRHHINGSFGQHSRHRNRGWRRDDRR